MKGSLRLNRLTTASYSTNLPSGPRIPLCARQSLWRIPQGCSDSELRLLGHDLARRQGGLDVEENLLRCCLSVDTVCPCSCYQAHNRRQPKQCQSASG